MNKYNRHRRGARSGMALMAVIVATFSVIGVLGVMLTLASFSSDQANTERRSAEAKYMGLGALEAAEKELLTAVANWRAVPTIGTVEIDGIPVDYTIEPTGFETLNTDSAGIQTIVTGYEVTAFGWSREARKPMRRVVNVESTPLFQFAVFYHDDLEIFPGPNMMLNGRVHTNSDLYMGSNNTLTCNTNYVRAVGEMYRRRKDAPNQSPGTVRIRKWVENPFDPNTAVDYAVMFSKSQMSARGVDTPSGYDSQFVTGVDLNGDGDFFGSGEWLPWGPGALHYWGPEGTADNSLPPNLPAHGYTVQDSAHMVSEAVVPSVGSIGMFTPQAGGDYVWSPERGRYIPAGAGQGTHSKGFFHEQADLAIIVQANGTWDAFDKAGTSVKFQLSEAIDATQIYDARQAPGSTATPTLRIDVEKLNDSGAFPANGLLYAAHYGMGTNTHAKGVMLVNGSELKAPLSVVSEGSIYVKGDFNTVAKKPAAVIGDAVNLLSNSWDGTKRPGTLPGASATTYNMAILSGNHATAVGQYNGGFENLPRFHENWSGVDCRISGAFVNTSKSLFATGNWVYGSDVYTAPNRIWSYDPMFNDFNLLPPFTPMAVSARDIVSW